MRRTFDTAALGLRSRSPTPICPARSHLGGRPQRVLYGYNLAPKVWSTGTASPWTTTTP